MPVPWFGNRDAVKNVRGRAMVDLTPQGRQAADDFGEDGPRQMILACLAERHPRTVKDLAGDCNMDSTKLISYLHSMEKEGLVTKLGGHSR